MSPTSLTNIDVNDCSGSKWVQSQTESSVVHHSNSWLYCIFDCHINVRLVLLGNRMLIDHGSGSTKTRNFIFYPPQHFWCRPFSSIVSTHSSGSWCRIIKRIIWYHLYSTRNEIESQVQTVTYIHILYNFWYIFQIELKMKFLFFLRKVFIES